MRKILGILFALLLLQPVLPHYKALYHVIVDTDGGPGDFRAICMMLASPEIEVIAITAVDGILSPEETASRIHRLLKHFHHEGIPVGVGQSNQGKSSIPEETATIAESLQWVKEGSPAPSGSQPGSLPGAVELILESIELEDMPVDIIALGPLINLAAVLEERPLIPDQVRKVYWYNGEESKKDFTIDIEEICEYVHGRCTVLGNLDAMGLLEHGSEVELRAEIKRQIKAGRNNGGRFIMSLGSPVTPGTPVTRVHLYHDLAHEA